jgi:hypothetical protein
MKAIYAEFVDDKQVDHEADCNTDGESANIDEREYAIFGEVAPGRFQIISKHMEGLLPDAANPHATIEWTVH